MCQTGIAPWPGPDGVMGNALMNNGKNMLSAGWPRVGNVCMYSDTRQNISRDVQLSHAKEKQRQQQQIYRVVLTLLNTNVLRWIFPTSDILDPVT